MECNAIIYVKLVCGENDTMQRVHDALILPLTHRWSHGQQNSSDSWRTNVHPVNLFSLFFSWLWHFCQALFSTHSIIMLDMSSTVLRQNTYLWRRLCVIKGWKNLQIPLSFQCSHGVCGGVPISSSVIKVGDWMCLHNTQRSSLQCSSMLLEMALARSCISECV